MRRWKARLHGCGLKLSTDSQPLTNLRYADDLLLFGNSFQEAVLMFEILSEDLAKVGLEINGKKTKLSTTDPEAVANDSTMLIDASDRMVELVRKDGSHKYLGRCFSGDLRMRGQNNLQHSSAWFKFHEYSGTLLNRNLPIALRLRLFDTVITPAALDSLSATPLTSRHLTQLDATQRKMMRKWWAGYAATKSHGKLPGTD